MRAEMLLFTCKGLMATQELNPGSLLLGGCFIWHQQGCWKTQVSLGDSKTHLRAISPAAWGLSLDPLLTEAGEFLPLRVWDPLWCAGKSILRLVGCLWEELKVGQRDASRLLKEGGVWKVVEERE